jgi:hypothetical protein
MKSVREILGISECVLIGSRALGIQEQFSDYDIVIHESNVPEKCKKDYELFDLREYFNVIPLGNNYLIRMHLKEFNIDIDLIIIEDKKNIDIYQKAIDIMKKVPVVILKNKYLRVAMFEYLLKEEGFIDKLKSK